MSGRNQEQLRNEIIQKAWKDAKFKQALLTDPKKALQEEFNITIPENVELKVVEETKNTFYLVLPTEPDVVGPDMIW